MRRPTDSELDAKYGTRDYAAIPRGPFYGMRQAEANFYREALGRVRNHTTKVRIPDKKTGKVLHELPVPPYALFMSREEVGEIAYGGALGSPAEGGRRVIRSLVENGLVRVEKAAGRAIKGFPRDILCFPLAQIHLTGRPGVPAEAVASYPHETLASCGQIETAESVCSVSDGVERGATGYRSPTYGDSVDPRDGVSALETVSRFANPHSSCGPNTLPEVTGDALLKSNGPSYSRQRALQVGGQWGPPPLPPVEPPEELRGGPWDDAADPLRVHETDALERPVSPEVLAIRTANVEKVKRMRAGWPGREVEDGPTLGELGDVAASPETEGEPMDNQGPEADLRTVNPALDDYRAIRRNPYAVSPTVEKILTEALEVGGRTTYRRALALQSLGLGDVVRRHPTPHAIPLVDVLSPYALKRTQIEIEADGDLRRRADEHLRHAGLMADRPETMAA